MCFAYLSRHYTHSKGTYYVYQMSLNAALTIRRLLPISMANSYHNSHVSTIEMPACTDLRISVYLQLLKNIFIVIIIVVIRENHAFDKYTM